MRSGTVLAGRYRLDRLAGRGGMGEVWQGRDLRLGRDVAVKLLLDLDPDPEGLKRFLRDATLAAGLQHPGITVVHDADQHDGRMFIVMEWLRGQDLAAHLAAHPDGLPVEQAVGFAVQVAEALGAVHASGIVHRDLKPQNIFVQAGGRLKVCDFGLARDVTRPSSVTAPGEIFGTPQYMAPEQWLAPSASASADLYQLGCVLYQVLTGTLPFPGPHPPAFMKQHLNDAPVPPASRNPRIPPDLNALVLSLLAKEPAERPRDAAAVLASLGEISDGLKRRAALRLAMPQVVKAKRSALGVPRVATAQAVAVQAVVPRVTPPHVAPASIACASPRRGHLEVFAVQAGDGIRRREFMAASGPEKITGWSGWEAIMPSYFGSVSVIAAGCERDFGLVLIAVLDQGSTLWGRRRDDEWTWWENAGSGARRVDSAIGARSPGDLSGFFLDANGRISFRVFPGRGGAVRDTSIPGPEHVTAIAASPDGNLPRLFAVADGVVWVREQEPGRWSARAWSTLPSASRMVDIACYSRWPGYLDAFALDESGHLWHTSWWADTRRSADWVGIPDPQVRFSAITANYCDVDRAMLFGVAADGDIYYAQIRSAGDGSTEWFPWNKMPKTGQLFGLL